MLFLSLVCSNPRFSSFSFIAEIFFKAVLEHATTATDDQIQLPKGVKWLSMRGNNPLQHLLPNDPRRVLFVRSFYKACFRDVMEGLRRKGYQLKDFIIIGQPGIGKSAFGMYLLFHLVREGRTVAYVPKNSSSFHGFVFRNGKVTLMRDEFDPVLSDPETVLICDSFKPPAVPARVVLITSPKRELWRAFEKDGAQRLHFPTFGLEELQEMRVACGWDHMSADQVTARFKEVGGNPRYVFLRFREDARQMFEEAAGKLNDPTILASLLGTSSVADYDGDKVSHRLFHVCAKCQVKPDLKPSSLEYYEYGGLVIASPLAAETADEKIRTLDDALCARLAASFSTNPHLRSAGGYIYETRAVKALSEGGDFELQPLVSGKARPSVVHLRVPSSLAANYPHFSLATLEAQVKTHPGAVLAAEALNQAAVDAILGGQVPLQITTASSHAVKVTERGLIGIVEKLGYLQEDKKRLAIPLVFVVPPVTINRRDSTWTRPQELVLPPEPGKDDAGARVAWERAVAVKARVKQYVMPLDVVKRPATMVGKKTRSIADLLKPLGPGQRAKLHTGVGLALAGVGRVLGRVRFLLYM